MMKKTYLGSFRAAALLDELLGGGLKVVTVTGNVNRREDSDSANTSVSIYFEDHEDVGEIDRVVAVHDSVAVDQKRKVQKEVKKGAKIRGAAKLRTFLVSELGMTDDEIGRRDIIQPYELLDLLRIPHP